jgi:hypothetical protein
LLFHGSSGTREVISFSILPTQKTGYEMPAMSCRQQAFHYEPFVLFLFDVRFPEDFMFQLTTEEKAEVVANCDHLSSLKYSPALRRLRSQNATLKRGQHRKYLPYVFNEHGALLLFVAAAIS